MKSCINQFHKTYLSRLFVYQCFLIFALIFLVIIGRQRKIQINDSLDIEDANNSMEHDMHVDISDKVSRVPSNKSNYVDTSDRFIRFLILKIG